jgi:diguanylate cyclase (GGDEF)-like protein
VLFLVSAMLWSLSDFLFRSNVFPGSTVLMGKIVVSIFVWTATQFYLFMSSFFPPDKGRWVIATVILMAFQMTLLMSGIGTAGVIMINDEIYPQYTNVIFLITIPMIFYAFRSAIILRNRMKNIDNPVLYSQILSILLSLGTMVLFIFASLLPFGKEFPISHFGNIIIAIILSYAIIRHRLVDIRFVLRQGAAWVTLGVLGAFTFWLLLVIFHMLFDFQLDLVASIIATLTAAVVAFLIYKVRGYFFEFISRAFQGSAYNYRRRLNEFTNKIHSVFSLKEQGGELLGLLLKAVNIKDACLLFPETGGEDFRTQFVESVDESGHLNNFRLRAGNPIIKYLEKEQRPLSRENLNILPTFLGLWPQEREEIESLEIALFVPLISRDRLIAILVLGRKQSGRYSLEDFTIIEDVTNRVAVSLEKEYLSEQLREREEELSVINSSSAILSSSLDIQEIFGSFLEELKKVVDVSWASIVLIEENIFQCVALSSSEGSAYQVGDRVPLEGTGTGWVVTQKKSFVEPDLSKEMYFTTGEVFFKLGLRTMVYLPLIAKGRAIGSFIVASKLPNAYSQRHIKLLEQLASQIAMPLENSQLYAKAEKKARVDELTRLLNRRSLDEMIDSEIGRHSRYGGTFSLAILDLDSFKTFNDTYGHLSGDRLLREVGHIIKSAIRNVDHAFRYGGDEFAILLPQTDINDALQVLERVREKIAKGLDSGDIHVTTSIGLASWPEDGITHTDIIAAADVTLYRAKRSGGNRSYCASGTPSASQLAELAAAKSDGVDSKYFNIVQALAEAVDSRCGLKNDHSRKVADCALALAKTLRLEPEETARLEGCALLHDLGKISISDAVLNKSADLTIAEETDVKKHPQVGADIVGRIPQLASCADGILHHHECYDGSGYPDGLKGDKIPLDSRIVAIADAFVNMTCERPRSANMSIKQAMEELKQCSGKRFDPYLVEQFISSYLVRNNGNHKKTRR